MWLIALRKVYEAEVAESTAIIDTFLKNSVGVADHERAGARGRSRVLGSAPLYRLRQR